MPQHHTEKQEEHVLHHTLENQQHQQKIIPGQHKNNGDAVESGIKISKPCEYYVEDDDDLAAGFYRTQKQQQQRQHGYETLVNDWITAIPGLKIGDLKPPENSYTNQAPAFQMMSSEEEDFLEIAGKYRMDMKEKIIKSLLENVKAP